tara:strand:+ start:198 stop:620 length:423 start_codon:yes stop_codon:yes gene_type:complete
MLDSQDSAYIALLDLKKATVWDIYHELFTCQPEVIWIEDVHSMFGMSAKSNFTFGRNLGSIHAIAEINCFGRPSSTVAPKVWQNFIGVTAKGKAIKKQVAEIATKLYPTANIHGKRGGLLDGRSDALMIAHYGLHNKEKV